MSFEQEWTRCGPWLQAALDEAPTTHTLDDVRGMVLRGEAKFWPFEKSAFVTLIWTEPQAKTLHHWLVGGDLADLLSHQPDIEAYARSQGCTRLFIAGRPGWKRVLEPHGYGFIGIAMSRELK